MKMIIKSIFCIAYIVISVIAAQILHSKPTFNGAVPDLPAKVVASIVVLAPLLAYFVGMFIWRSRADEYEKALFDRAAATGAIGGLVFMLIVEVVGDFTGATGIRVEMVPAMTLLYFMINMSRLKTKGLN